MTTRNFRSVNIAINCTKTFTKERKSCARNFFRATTITTIIKLVTKVDNRLPRRSSSITNRHSSNSSLNTSRLTHQRPITLLQRNRNSTATLSSNKTTGIHRSRTTDTTVNSSNIESSTQALPSSSINSRSTISNSSTE